MDGKKETPFGIPDGIDKDPKRSCGKAPKAPFGNSVSPSYENLSPPEQEKKVREPHELQEEAWRLMDQAVTSGKMILEDKTEVRLNADSLIRVIQWLASAKAKKPHIIPTPEDYVLKETTGQED